MLAATWRESLLLLFMSPNRTYKFRSAANHTPRPTESIKDLRTHFPFKHTCPYLSHLAVVTLICFIECYLEQSLLNSELKNIL